MSARDELRWGIAGAGYIAGVHSAALRAATGTFADLPRVRLVAVADPDHARARALSDAWGWERAEADWTAITRAEDVDVVAVCVPNVHHAEIAIDALEHGKHVICEKPLAHDLAGARAMAAAAASSGTVTQVCFYYRLWPAVARARRLVDDGAIGQVRYVRGWMLQDYAARPEQELGWRADRAQAGAGALGDLGSHVIDLTRHLCGELVDVCASTHELVDRGGGAAGIDDAVSALVQFENGAAGVLEASWAMCGHKCDLGFDLVGSEGGVRFSWERSNELEVLAGDPGDQAGGYRRELVGPGQPGVERFVSVAGQGLGYRDAFTIGIGRFAAAVAGAGDAGPSFADGLRVAEVIDAAQRSAATRSWTAPGS